MHCQLARRAEFVGEAQMQGRLYGVDWYPGAVRSGDKGDIVHGEVYRLLDSDRALAELDAYEGCKPSGREAPEFAREKTRVECADGREIEAWVYFFTGNTRGLKRIDSGEFTFAQ